MPNPTSIAVLDANSTQQTVSTMDALLAVEGGQADAAASNGASGSMMAYLRAIKDNATSTAPSPVVLPGSYKAVAASQLAALCGATGAAGDYLSHVTIIPATTSPGAVSIMDGGAAMSPPTANTPTTSTTGGTLAAGTYYYKITALGAVGETLASNEVSVTTTGTTSSNTITWSAVTGATGYRVYRGTAAAGENVYYAPGNVLTYTDTNAASTSASPPSSNSALTIAPTTIFAGGSSSVSSLVPFAVPLGLNASAGWKINTGANVSVIAAGKFT